MATTSKYDSFVNAFWLVANVVAVVGIVTANKLVFGHFKFHFGTLLTVIHFASTSLCLEIGKTFGWIERKSGVSWMKVLPLSIAFCGFVVLTNLSLQYNSVGFYQMAKVMTTPIMALLQFTFYGKRFTRGILATLGLVCVGVCLATATEFTLTLVGFSIAFAACFVTAIYSIWVETEQQRLGLNALQLLSYQAPLSALILVGFVPIFDNYKEIISYKMSFFAASAIATSAFLAFIVNMSTFMIIGKMSAITYNVAGHAKLCFVLAAGYLFFDSKFSWLNMCGVAIAISGVVAYSVIKMMPPKSTESVAQTTKHIAIPLNDIDVNASEPELEDEANAQLKTLLSESDAPSTDAKRSLLIFNNEPVLLSNKITPFSTEKSEKIKDNELLNKENQMLIK